jgi:large subunit ribosomal protein L4
MSLNLNILKNKKLSTKEAFESLSEYEVREALLAQVIRAELLNLRGGNAHTKIRSEVSGGGKKPWKQKGTGRARHGSTRSPIWVGGGVAHGPRNTVNWHRKINKTSRVAALKSIIKDRLMGDVVFELEDKGFVKTKDALDCLNVIYSKQVAKTKQTLIIYSTQDKQELMGFKNTGVEFLNVRNLKLFKIANSQVVILTPTAREFLELRLK